MNIYSHDLDYVEEFVIQEVNDPQVVKSESDQIIESHLAKGREVTYMVLEGNGPFDRRPTLDRVSLPTPIAQFMERRTKNRSQFRNSIASSV